MKLNANGVVKWSAGLRCGVCGRVIVSCNAFELGTKSFLSVAARRLLGLGSEIERLDFLITYHLFIFAFFLVAGRVVSALGD